jgi:hypothetical protein
MIQHRSKSLGVDSDEARHANESIENATGKKSATQRARRATENTEERQKGRTEGRHYGNLFCD